MMDNEFRGSPAAPERLLTIKVAADLLGIHYWKLRRAVKQGGVPSYTLQNSRRLVKLSEVVAAIEASRRGGGVCVPRQHP